MSTSNNPSSSANQDDPWEQLAEDLFGLEYGKEHAATEPAPAADEPVAPPAPESHPPPAWSHAEVVPDDSRAVEDPPRFAAAAEESDLTFGESDEPGSASEP